MNEIKCLLENPPEGAGFHLSVRDKTVCITGNPQGLKLLARILEHQADGKGSGPTSCSTTIAADQGGKGVLQKTPKSDSLALELHCHDDYF